MGRKGKWFSSVKKALSPESKKKKDQKLDKLKHKDSGSDSTTLETVTLPPLPSPSHPQPVELRLTEVENEENKQDYSLAVSSAAAAEASAAADDDDDDNDESVVAAAAEVVGLHKVTRFAGKPTDEVAAIRIQTALRGYLARRALQSLRGVVRLKTLMEGTAVKRQASNTLKCMQTLSRVHSQIHSRRIRMTEENQALQRQLLQKHAKELVNLQIGEEWDDSLQSKEQVEANLLSKYEATMRRERAMAYSFTHQQTRKNLSRSVNPMFMDPRNPTWGWSWLERWMASRPWEGRGVTEKELNNDHSSVKSASIVAGEISRSYARYQLNSVKHSPTASQKPIQTTSPRSPLTPAQPAFPAGTRKLKSASPRGGVRGLDDDTKSMVSMKSERKRRHSIPGPLARDDESLIGTPRGQRLPSYMVPTESARAKSRLQNPSGAEDNGIPETGLLTPAKKQIPFPPSPARQRRHSGPPKMDSSITAENSVSNAGDS
ncbi:IQ domain-containing protein/DUF4005 domain-containing protein [Cephalotus follicularis]|uniref:IQ domain-containing protein/DUF4005 domain-containing protein n=1 Tax=Cephalotus follicularis TaxID=3775 RepID=A0A1Q3CPV0_CEPFO|nr:IQ domain-containing protein/DUF4005 domain-containing protein [Cephalotus follicularis]